MKNKFPGYFKHTDSEINELWEKALFTLDANILLNLYRYSDETKEDFLKILSKLKDRIWIPHQSAQEFFDNRLNVISQQEKSYEDAISALNSMEKEFKNSRQHPFINDRLLNRFSTLSKEICEQLSVSKEFHNNRILDDDILAKIQELFENKVGDEYNEEDLGKLYKEGEYRFTNKIPPGYKDLNKKDDASCDTRKYGDFIVWKQIIDKSKEINQGIILVTDDRKEDWWTRFKGKTVSPRPELTKEFTIATDQSFHMYQSDRFLEFARDYLNETISANAIEEIRELRRLDEIERLRKIRNEKEYLKLREFKETLMKERIMLEEEYRYIHDKKNQIEEAIKNEYLILDNTDHSEYDERKIMLLQRELHGIDLKVNHLSDRIKELHHRELKEREIRNKTLHNKRYS